jgi:hypothetical protein
MRRRDCITFLAGAMTVWPLASEADAGGRLPQQAAVNAHSDYPHVSDPTEHETEKKANDLSFEGHSRSRTQTIG